MNEPTLTRLDLSLLGPFAVRLDGEPITGFASDKVRALLAYLAVEGRRPHRRDALAGLLWPDYPDSDALASLRQAIHKLRQALSEGAQPEQANHGVPFGAPPFLLVTPQTVQLDLAEWDAAIEEYETKHRREEGS